MHISTPSHLHPLQPSPCISSGQVVSGTNTRDPCFRAKTPRPDLSTPAAYHINVHILPILPTLPTPPATHFQWPNDNECMHLVSVMDTGISILIYITYVVSNYS